MEDILQKIGFDLSTFIFQLINFTIVALLLYKFLFKKVVNVVEERETVISEGIEKYNSAEEQLKQAEIEKQKIIAEAELAAKQLREEAKRKIDAERTEVVNAAIAESSTLIKSTRENLASEKTQMLKDFKKDAVDVILSTAQKISKQSGIKQKDNIDSLVVKSK